MSIQSAIKSLRERNEPVPLPLRLPTEAEVTAAERALNLSFPPDYRYYLLHASDIVYGTLEPAIVLPDSGHLNLLEVVKTARDLGVPADLLPFCEDNGDYYCIAKDGHVVLWSHDGMFSGKWPDLAIWINQIWIGN